MFSRKGVIKLLSCQISLHKLHVLRVCEPIIVFLTHLKVTFLIKKIKSTGESGVFSRRCDCGLHQAFCVQRVHISAGAEGHAADSRSGVMWWRTCSLARQSWLSFVAALQMAALCWATVTLGLLLFVGTSVAAVEPEQLENLVTQVLNR